MTSTERALLTALAEWVIDQEHAAGAQFGGSDEMKRLARLLKEMQGQDAEAD